MPPEPRTPLAYFITFRTYGTWLHGDDHWSVDDRRNKPGEPFLGTMPRLAEYERGMLRGTPKVFTTRERDVVAEVIREVAAYRSWQILAINVRTNHVHVVVLAPSDTPPERVMGDFKRWSTRRLREQRLVAADESVWAVHGSTRWLWSRDQVSDAVDYVMNRQ